MKTSLLTAILMLAACGGAAEAPTATAPAVEPTADAPKPVNPHEGMDHAAMGMAFTPLEGAKVMFLSPADGATVSSPVHLTFGLEGAQVKPAGEVVPGTGHHHVIVDGSGVEAGVAVPADTTHIHFGKGQTETDLELTPGEHTLTLQLADGLHRSYGPALTSTIKVTVSAPE
jgi:hypothetical protein